MTEGLECQWMREREVILQQLDQWVRYLVYQQWYLMCGDFFNVADREKKCVKVLQLSNR